MVLKKLNLTQQRQTTREQNSRGLAKPENTQNAKPKQMHKN